MKTLIQLIIIVLLSGCGTIESLREEGRSKDEHCYLKSFELRPPKGSPVYSGVKWHFAEDPGPKVVTSCTPLPAGFVPRCWLNVIDLPLCIVADTVLLPYTLFTD